MSKRIVITGGGGFIGSHLSRRLLDEGNTIICIDNFFTSCKRTIEPLLDHPSYELITHDIIDPVFVTDVDQIFNLACPAAPGHYQFNPVRTTKTSVMGVINMLGMAKATGARILQASTSEVYGTPTISPQPETYRGNVNPIGRRACYDEGKRAAETLFFDYHRENHVDIRVARIFNTYGPNMHPFDGRVVSNFIRQALAGEDITVFGEGLQTRSFCYVSDLVDGLIRLMNMDDLTGPVNLGNPQELTILDLAEHVIELTGSTSQLVRRPLPPDDPTQRCPDITLAKERLGWIPQVELREGLGQAIDYFRGLDFTEWIPPTPYWEAPPVA
ncbi:MAG: SDR family oxidoreductase [Phycisphaerales bacterium]|jgi:UDP-glucuronate decarboxylase|nr:SDR family oxidoreductase [Phycisphaerales bacterium]